MNADFRVSCRLSVLCFLFCVLGLPFVIKKQFVLPVVHLLSDTPFHSDSGCCLERMHRGISETGKRGIGETVNSPLRFPVSPSLRFI